MPAAALLAAALLVAGTPGARLDALEARRRAEEAAARMLAEQERSVLGTLGEIAIGAVHCGSCSGS